MNTSSKKIYSVSELTYQLKSLLEGNFNQICIKGEISNLKKQSSGHLYFSLKDESAQISAALFKGNTFNLTKLPKDGDQVVAYGDISIYPPRGNYQIIVRQIQFLGVGGLLAKLHELKEKLKNKGYFNPENKKKLPTLPQTIGVVTSPTGSVIQDILNVLKRRYFNFNLLLNPVKVQGEGAAEEIAKAINDFNKYKLADVLIVGRGGGSLEDLWPFNEEIVAEAIYNSKIPIISAVGHETDFSISDFVADVRAPTPSAAAEIVISEKNQLLKNILNYNKQITSTISHKINLYQTRLNSYLMHPSLSSSCTLLSKYYQQLDEFRSQNDMSIKNLLEQKKGLHISYIKQLKALNPKNNLLFLKEKLLSKVYQIERAMINKMELLKNSFSYRDILKELDWLILKIINNKKENLIKLTSHLKSLDPKNLLKKGYSILFSEKENSIILSSKEIKENQTFYALMHDGKIKAKVEKQNE